jgi:anti-anti-sigma regulatory factor
VLSRDPGDAGRLRRLIAATPATAVFDCEIRAEPDVLTFTPRGAVDVATASMLDADLRAARALGFGTLVVDLRHTRSIDAAGAQVLARWAGTAERDGFELRVEGYERAQARRERAAP